MSTLHRPIGAPLILYLGRMKLKQDIATFAQ